MKFVQQYWREVVILILIVTIGITMNMCQNHRLDKDRLESNLKISQDSVHHFKNKNKELVGQVGSMQLTTNDLKENGKQLGLNVDSLQKQVGSLKNLVSYYKGKVKVGGEVTGITHDTVIQHIYHNDTTKVKEKEFKWSNGYLFLTTLYNPTNDSISIKYRYETGFTLTAYRKRRAFFSFKKDLVADFVLKDPNGTLVNGKSVTIIPAPRKFYEKWWFHTFIGALGATYIWKKDKL